MRELFDESCGAEGLIDTAFLHRLQTFRGNANSYLFVEFRHEDSLLLDVYLVASLPGRVEFRRTSTVRIAAPDATSLACYDAFSCHIFYICSSLVRK